MDVEGDQSDGPAREAPDALASPEVALALIRDQAGRVRRQATVNSSFIMAIWGVAWLLGFGAAYLSSGPHRVIPGWLGPTMAGMLTVGGVALSVVHSVRANRGIVGASRSTATRYGWSWTIGFGGLFVLNSLLSRSFHSSSAVTMLWTVSSLCLVGVLLLAGYRLWKDKVLAVMGGWMLLSAVGSAFVGVPGNFLVLALAGGGGFLALAGYLMWREIAADRRMR